MELKNKTFIIFGASSGIGQGIANELSKNNRVGTFSRRPVKEVADNRIHFQGDVTSIEDVQKAFALFKDKWKRVDGFVFSAGIAQKTDFSQFKSKEAQEIMNTNFFGFTNCLEVFLPDLMERKDGLIAMVSALSVSRSMPLGASYFATKAAQHVFFEGLRIDLEESGIQLSEIRPGLVDTPMSRAAQVSSDKMWSVERATKFILREIENGASDISFPLDLKLLNQTSQLLPDSAYFKIIRSQVEKSLQKKT